MTELPDTLHAEITRLSDAGNDLAAAGQYENAITLFRQALALIPAPQENWDATMWLWVAIGDMQFLLGRFAESRASFMDVVKYFDDGRANPFVRLRLGQSMLELGESQEASNWLAGAYLQDGAALFAEEDPKYLAFIKTQLKPPPGGWPDD
jgi:tetratricopeptide (TPR) repeat protein